MRRRVDRIRRGLDHRERHRDGRQFGTSVQSGLSGTGVRRRVPMGAGMRHAGFLEGPERRGVEGDLVTVEKAPVLDPPVQLGVAIAWIGQVLPQFQQAGVGSGQRGSVVGRPG